jgi:AraC-like DNA-binding protein
MSQVYLTRAGNLGPIRKTIESAGGNLDRVISKASLSHSVFENPDLLIPLSDVFLILEFAAQELDDPVFGANLGKHTLLSDLGDLGTIVAGQSTLQQAINFTNSNICEMVQEGTELELRDDGPYSIWSYRILERPKNGYEQDGMLSLGLMTALIRNFTRDDWLPSAVVVPETVKFRPSELEEIIGANVHCNGEKFALMFEQGLIARSDPVSSGRAVGPPSSPATICIPKADDIVSITRHMCDLESLGGFPMIEGVANRMGLQPRTLQRRLQEHGVKFRRIRLEAIMARANALLTQSNWPIARIATDLGYAETSQFSRAYQRWAGLAPKDARSVPAIDTGDTMIPSA